VAAATLGSVEAAHAASGRPHTAAVRAIPARDGHRAGTTADVTVGQGSIPEIAPGETGCIEATFSSDLAVDDPSATFTFTSPQGTHFVPGQAVDWWHPGLRYPGSVSSYEVSADGTTLTFRDNPALWAARNGHGTEDDVFPLTYCVPVRVDRDAEPGLATGGTAGVGDSPTGSLVVRVAGSSPSSPASAAPATDLEPSAGDGEQLGLARTGMTDTTSLLEGAAVLITLGATVATIMRRTRNSRHR
jgi:hypothetical protein